jgi:hypothetical protein
VAVSADLGVDDATVADAYLNLALPFILQGSGGHEAIHASAVVGRTGVSLFCGASGAGKSTIASAFSRRGLDQWADDVVVLTASQNDRFESVPLPFQVNVREPAASHLSNPTDRTAPTVGSQSVVARSPREPLRTIFLLRPDAARESPAFERLGAARALAFLLPNTFRFRPATPEQRRQTIDAYLRLVTAVPVWRVSYPQDLAQLPALLDRLQERMG